MMKSDPAVVAVRRTLTEEQRALGFQRPLPLTADAIYAYVAMNDWVTFAELWNVIGETAWGKGTLAIVSPTDPNILFWVGMTPEVVDTIQGLTSSKRLFYHSTVFLTYLIDGRCLQIPTLKRVPKQPLKSERWLPVCLRAVPIAEKRRKRAVVATAAGE